MDPQHCKCQITIGFDTSENKNYEKNKCPNCKLKIKNPQDSDEEYIASNKRQRIFDNQSDSNLFTSKYQQLQN